MTPVGQSILASFLMLSVVTGTISIEETVNAPARSMALLHDPETGPTIFLHFLIVGGIGFWTIFRVARWTVPAERARTLRIVGWVALPLLIALLWPSDSGSANENPRMIALGAITTVVPILPMLAGGLLFDLALQIGRRGSYRSLAPNWIPPSAIYCAILGGALAYSWTGVLALGSAMNEWPGPMRFEHLGAPGLLALFPLLVMIPVGILWALVATFRS